MLLNCVISKEGLLAYSIYSGPCSNTKLTHIQSARLNFHLLETRNKAGGTVYYILLVMSRLPVFQLANDEDYIPTTLIQESKWK